MRAAQRYDAVCIEDLEVFAHHGVFPEETALGQKFLLSIKMYLDTRPAGTTDDLNASVNYGEVSAFATSFTQKHTCKLIEAAAEQLAAALLERYPLAGVTVELKKPWAPVGLPLKTVSVQITRFWHTAYLGLGSNMGDKEAYLDGAVAALNGLDGCHVEAVSPYLVTKPYGGVEQDDFLNACLKLRTLLPPEELLTRLHEIEQAAKRVRMIRWGPRTLDLDILMYDDLVYESDDLMIPHIEMHLRQFVLLPLSQIAPNVRHPIFGKTVSQMLEAVSDK